MSDTTPTSSKITHSIDTSASLVETILSATFWEKMIGNHGLTNSQFKEAFLAMVAMGSSSTESGSNTQI